MHRLHGFHIADIKDPLIPANGNAEIPYETGHEAHLASMAPAAYTACWSLHP